MPILSGPEIARLRQIGVEAKARGEVVVPSVEIDPFDESRIGPNSYDVLLSDQLKVYAIHGSWYRHYDIFRDLPKTVFDPRDNEVGVDAHNPPATVDLTIPPEGMWLYPGVLYLGATVERTLCHGIVPWLDGRSSVGRLGLSVHVTAGRGDDNWAGRWTCEITAVAHPVKVYPNMRMGQLTFFTMVGERKPYAGHYQEQDGPTASRLHLNVPEAKK